MGDLTYKGRTYTDVPDKARIVRVQGFATQGPAPGAGSPFTTYLGGFNPLGGTGYMFSRRQAEGLFGPKAEVQLLEAGVSVNENRHEASGSAAVAALGGTANVQTMLGLGGLVPVKVRRLVLGTNVPVNTPPNPPSIAVMDGGVLLGSLEGPHPYVIEDFTISTTLAVTNLHPTAGGIVGAVARIGWQGFYTLLLADVVRCDIDAGGFVLNRESSEPGTLAHMIPAIMDNGRGRETVVVDPQAADARLGSGQAFTIGVSQDPTGSFPTGIDLQGEIIVAVWNK